MTATLTSPKNPTIVPEGASSPNKSSIHSTSWNAFVAASPYGDVLQCHEWGQVKRPDWFPLPVALHDGDGIDATALVLRRAIPRTRRTIFYIPRGPILDWSQPDIADSLITKLRELAKLNQAVLIKIDPAVPASTPGVADTLRRLGFQPSPDVSGSFGGTQPRCVMKLDISAPLDDVMARFHSKWRYNIRIAERKGVEVQQDCTRDDLKVFHDIYRVTAQRDGFTGRPLAYFQKLWDALVEKNLVKLFLTYYQGQPLSGAICFILPPQCWYVYGASSNEYRNLMPNHLMQWAMIQWAKERGCTVYDFRGVHDVPKAQTSDTNGSTMNSLMESPDGLVRFKAGFGAELVEYIGEWDLPLSRGWYWMWTTGRPRLMAALRKMRKQRLQSTPHAD